MTIVLVFSKVLQYLLFAEFYVFPTYPILISQLVHCSVTIMFMKTPYFITLSSKCLLINASAAVSVCFVTSSLEEWCESGNSRQKTFRRSLKSFLYFCMKFVYSAWRESQNISRITFCWMKVLPQTKQRSYLTYMYLSRSIRLVSLCLTCISFMSSMFA